MYKAAVILALMVLAAGLSQSQQEQPCIGRIEIFAVSANRELLAAHSSDTRIIYLVDVASGGVFDQIAVKKDHVTAITFSDDNGLIAWGESDEFDPENMIGYPIDGSLVVYDREVGAVVARLTDLADVVDRVAISQDNETVSFRSGSAGYGHELQVWEIASQSRISMRESWWMAPAYTGDPESIFFGSVDYPEQTSIFEWDALIANSRQRVGTHSRITALTLSEDRRVLASADDDGQLILWNTGDLSQRSAFAVDITGASNLEFIDANTLLVSGTRYVQTGPARRTTAEFRVWRIASEPEIIARKSLKQTEPVAIAVDAVIYLLDKQDSRKQIVVWDYVADTLTPLQFFCE